jgi:hypothetical protein
MPQQVEASVRDLPSSTNVNASILRAASAFFVRLAESRNCSAV